MRVKFDVLQNPIGQIEAEEHPQLRPQTLSKVVERVMRLLSAEPEAAFAPDQGHEIIVQADNGFAQPITDRNVTWGEVLDHLQGAQEVLVAVTAEARQGVTI